MCLIGVLIYFVIFDGLLASGCPDQDENLLPWSEPSTWDSNTLPVAGSVVTIDVPILLDVTSLTLSEINIVGSGQLVFSDEVGDISITTNGIVVQDTGRLVIGSEDCRFQHNVNIKLTGNRTADRSLLDAKGEKYIAVQDEGSLQIYGKDKLPWTKLSATINRWEHDEENIVYSHRGSYYYSEAFRSLDGPAMYIFYECNLQPKYYRVFNFDQGGNLNGEQKQVDEMIDALNGIEDGDIVAIAIQRKSETTANRTELFSTLEALSGISRVALRDTAGRDAYALVFQKGGDSHEELRPGIGTNKQTARASIVVKGKKVTAESFMKGQTHNSVIDFRIIDVSVGFPTVSVIDDISSWQAGDKVIVTSTDYSMHHTEERTIKEITSDFTFTLTDELDYRHFGEIEDGVDMRAEVALLTRNIKIEGVMSRSCPENNENCNEFGHDTYGAHTKIMGFSSVHIEGVEFVNVGQTTDKGFYPIHFHMCQDISGKEAILKANSIHNSYARAVTVHGTWANDSSDDYAVQVLNNVAYDIIGHCYFLEDGAEKKTILDGNLGATIKSVNGNGFVTDRTGPSVFWITNPKIILTNNVAVGAAGFGIWYVFPDEPVGPSQGLGAFGFREARNTPLWTFDNNVVHSNKKGGMNFDNVLVNEDGATAGCMNYRPVVDPFNKHSTPVKVQLTRLTAYKNLKINTWLRGGLFELIQYSCAESRRGLQIARGSPQQQFMTKSIVVGRSRGNFEEEDYPDAPDSLNHYLGIVFYDGPVYIEKTWFNGFETVADQYAGAALGFNPKNKFTSSIVSNVTDLRFGFVDRADGTGGNRVYDGTEEDELLGFGNFDGDESATFRDGDGSVTGCPGADWSQPLQVVKPEKYILTDECRKRENWQMVICDNFYGKMQFKLDKTFPGVNKDDFPAEAQSKRLNKYDLEDVAYEDHTGLHTTEFMTILGSDKYYYLLQFVQDFPKKVYMQAKGVEPDYPVVAGVCLPEGLSTDEIKLTAWRPPGVSTQADGWIFVDSIDEVFADNTMSRAHLDGRYNAVCVNTVERDSHWNKYDTDNCPTGTCPSFSVEILRSNITSYSPCYTPTDEELNTDVHLDNIESMSCDLPASLPEPDWGAGDTRRTAVESDWGEWSSWSDCCGAGVSTWRYRLCDNPTPLGSADGCSGESNDTQACTTECLVDGLLGEWSRWSDCFCDGIAQGSYGAKTRTRSCENVAGGGDFCSGPLIEGRPCYGNCN